MRRKRTIPSLEDKSWVPPPKKHRRKAKYSNRKTAKYILNRKKLDMNISHACVDNGTIRNSFGTFCLGSSHDLFFRRFLIKDISVRICALCIFWFTFSKLKNKRTEG